LSTRTIHLIHDNIEDHQMSFRKFSQALAIAVASLVGLTANALAFNIDESVEGFWWESALQANRGWGLQSLTTGPEAGVVVISG